MIDDDDDCDDDCDCDCDDDDDCDDCDCDDGDCDDDSILQLAEYIDVFPDTKSDTISIRNINILIVTIITNQKDQ